jgi:hypothetical protein
VVFGGFVSTGCPVALAVLEVEPVTAVLLPQETRNGADANKSNAILNIVIVLK